jgi:hypothetical protein
MMSVRREETQHQLRLHRFAVRLYETLVERYGIQHEEAELALRLVEATNTDGGDVAVSVPSGRELRRTAGPGYPEIAIEDLGVGGSCEAH